MPPSVQDKPPQKPAATMPDIFRQIDQISKRLKYCQRRTMQEAHLTPPQYLLLSLLWEKDCLPFKDLAAASFTSRATITGIIDTMEKKGLVVRQANPADRRSLLVKLTPQGKSIRNDTPDLEKFYKSCCFSLTEAELQQLSTLLEKLESTLCF